MYGNHFALMHFSGLARSADGRRCSRSPEIGLRITSACRSLEGIEVSSEFAIGLSSIVRVKSCIPRVSSQKKSQLIRDRQTCIRSVNSKTKDWRDRLKKFGNIRIKCNTTLVSYKP
ncbi:uncharacterized protein LOC116841580 [Odontomachus brunneus]|uniref:uncharacterized protein LOC116841580 n=1 Tax=Odontomachus brunneus TaxID=486640 RepID=UPI0013F1C65D|nr:uncharacterized protein LOC116841580 [Odontomachus brunneus]